MQKTRVKGLIYSVSSYGENDLIVGLLTVERGEVRLFLRGGRKLKSKNRLLGNLYRIVEVDIGRGKGSGLFSASGARLIAESDQITKSYGLQLALSSYIETLRLVGGHSEPEAIEALMCFVENTDNNNAEVSGMFVLYAIAANCLGYMFDLQTDCNGNSLDERHTYRLGSRSSLEPSVNGVLGANEIKLLRLVNQGESVRKLLNIQTSVNVNASNEMKDYLLRNI